MWVEFGKLKKTLQFVQNPVVFCHNDLILANVLYNEDESTVTFIDYEYAGYNYQAFDIATHFSAFPGELFVSAVNDEDFRLNV